MELLFPNQFLNKLVGKARVGLMGDSSVTLVFIKAKLEYMMVVRTKRLIYCLSVRGT